MEGTLSLTGPREALLVCNYVPFPGILHMQDQCSGICGFVGYWTPLSRSFALLGPSGHVNDLQAIAYTGTLQARSEAF